MPLYRFLKGYSLDPSFSGALATHSVNQTVYRIRWEENLAPGPCGEYINVIDYDSKKKSHNDPVDLNAIPVLAEQGLNPSEGNLQFHQQFVYTIGMQTIETFEEALGRKIIWRRYGVEGFPKEDYVCRLKIYPHAKLSTEAIYSSEKVALLFGYFQGDRQNKTGGSSSFTTFTCLSPDVVAHEVTHAVLDSIYPYFQLNTNIDVIAFNEAFADLVALLQRFSNKDLIMHQLEASSGRASETVLGDFATQMGRATTSTKRPIRQLIGERDEKGVFHRRKPNPEGMRTATEFYKRGELLVASLFDAMVRLYRHKTKDLFRIAGEDPDQPSKNISIDLVNRLADELIEIAKNLNKICIQALDYVAPCDINFGDYYRALITADYEISPSDDLGYRTALIESLRNWGVQVERVDTLSVESMIWDDADEMFDTTELDLVKQFIDLFKPIMREFLRLKDRKKIYDKYKEIKEILAPLLNREYDVIFAPGWPKSHNDVSISKNKDLGKILMDEERILSFLDKLGLVRTNKQTLTIVSGERKMQVTLKEVGQIEVLNVRSVHRVSRAGQRIDQVVVGLGQNVKFESGEPSGNYNYYGGCSLVFDLTNQPTLKYAIVKRVGSDNRLIRQLEYYRLVDTSLSESPDHSFGSLPT